jgi:hypothetical protein
LRNTNERISKRSGRFDELRIHHGFDGVWLVHVFTRIIEKMIYVNLHSGRAQITHTDGNGWRRVQAKLRPGANIYHVLAALTARLLCETYRDEWRIGGRRDGEYLMRNRTILRIADAKQ